MIITIIILIVITIMMIVSSHVTDTSSSAHILSLTSLVFTTYLCNRDITTTKKMLLPAISELQ